MRKIKEILRLKYACGLSKREIGRSCNVARSTVADYLMRARAVGVNWPDAAELTEAQLEERLFPTKHLPSSVHRPPPDCEHIYDQLRRYRNVNLTLTQLWLEYKEKHPLPTMLQFFDYRLHYFLSTFGAERMAPADSGTTVRAGKLRACFQTQNADCGVGKVDLLHPDSQSFGDAACQVI